LVKEYLSETLLFTFTDDKKKILFIVTKKQILKYKNNINYLHGELAAVFGLVALPGTIFTFLRFFFFIFFCNLIGLAPYIFTRSSHMSFTLTLALPI